MTLEYDLFWSFRSPYSYLVTPRLIEFEREYDVKTNVRPVYPIAVRIPGFFKQVNPMWPPYLFRDCSRIAEMLGMSFAWPSPDPIVMNMGTGEVAEGSTVHPPTDPARCRRRRCRQRTAVPCRSERRHLWRRERLASRRSSGPGSGSCRAGPREARFGNRSRA